MENSTVSEYWKRVKCCTVVHARYQNADVMTATQYSVNIANAVKLDICGAAGFGSWIYQQKDKLFTKNFYDFTRLNFWLPNLTVCYSQNYYLWDVVEKYHTSSTRNTTTKLVAKIKLVIKIFPRTEWEKHAKGLGDVLRTCCKPMVVSLSTILSPSNNLVDWKNNLRYF